MTETAVASIRCATDSRILLEGAVIDPVLVVAPSSGSRNPTSVRTTARGELPADHVDLMPTGVITSESVSHLSYRVLRGGPV